MKRLAIILATLLLAACAAYSGSGLKSGEARLEDVLRVIGRPAMRWQEPDGALDPEPDRKTDGVMHTGMLVLTLTQRGQRWMQRKGRA